MLKKKQNVKNAKMPNDKKVKNVNDPKCHIKGKRTSYFLYRFTSMFLFPMTMALAIDKVLIDGPYQSNVYPGALKKDAWYFRAP